MIVPAGLRAGCDIVGLAAARQIIEGGVELADVPHQPTVNLSRLRHPAIGDHFVELRRADADIASGILTAQAAGPARLKAQRSRHDAEALGPHAASALAIIGEPSSQASAR